MSKTRIITGPGAIAILVLAVLLANVACASAKTSGKLILAHYMAWYQADPVAGKWGWHWTMNHFDPNQRENGRRQIASHYTPLIGPYDSGDPDVAECEALLMKFAGIDGAVIDWHGTADYYDYAAINRNAELMAEALRRAGLKYAIMYEDDSVRQLIKGNRLAPADAVRHGQQTLEWLQTHWFSSPSYVTFHGKPLLMVWGGYSAFYQAQQWNQIFSVLPAPPAYFTELGLDKPAIGGFGWPVPDKGTKASFTALNTFYSWYSNKSDFIAVAYPRYNDIYVQAGARKSVGSIDDQNGKTYEVTLKRALTCKSPITQIATWNDWGEGTQIEPSVEYGYRDLETTQRLRKKYIDPSFPYTPADLRLPVLLLNLRRASAGDSTMQGKLDRAASLLDAGRTAEARALLARLEQKQR